MPALTRLGYSGVYKQRTGDDKRDGCALFYRVEKLSLLSHHAVEFCQPDMAVLDRDNVAVMAKFCHKNAGHHSKVALDIFVVCQCSLAKLYLFGSPQPFVVATTHILFNKRRTDIKLSQLAVLLTDLDSFAREEGPLGSGHVPVILSGDFNMTPDSPIISNFVQGGVIDYRAHIHPIYRLPRNLGVCCIFSVQI